MKLLVLAHRFWTTLRQSQHSLGSGRRVVLPAGGIVRYYPLGERKNTMSELLQTIGSAAGYCLFYLAMLAGVMIIPLGFPGQFIIVAAACVFSLIAGSDALSWRAVLLLFGIALFAEIIEAVAGFMGARGAKGSIWSSFGAAIGGIIGAIVCSMVAPIIGSLFGAFAGTFAGAYGVEYYRSRTSEGAAAVARGALIGRVVGSFVKVFLAIVMIAVVTFALL